MTITVSCPACSTEFPVDPAKIPTGGVRAQCSACPEIFGVDHQEESEAESTFVESQEAAADPSAPVDLEEMEAPPEAQSALGDDTEIVSDIATDTSNEFGERELSFDPITTEADAELAMDTDLEVPPPMEAFGEIDAAVPAAIEKVEGDGAAPAEPATEEKAPAPSGGAIQFGKRGPEDKARSLARSLVSDLIAYNPDKHTEALASGRLVQVFSEEIKKSWKEYRDQVDPDVVTQGTFFNDALNELIANGESVFTVEG